MPTLDAIACPKCGFEPPAADADRPSEACARCGLVFARWRERQQAAQLAAATVREQAVNPADVPDGTAAAPLSDGLDAAARRALAVGAVAGLALYALPLTRFLLQYLATLVHELGHAAVGWSFGYPSIPAFDFMYGGGVTMLDQRNTGVLIFVYAGFAALGWWLWKRGAQVALAILALFVAVYSMAAFTPAHEALFLVAGHAAELLFAGIFLYRALSGSACRTPGERPLYGAVATFLLLHAAGFAWRLMTDAAFRVEYEEAKGGGRWMDFSRLGEEFLGAELQTVAAAFLFAAVATPLVTWAVLRGRSALEAAAARLTAGS